MLNLPLQRLQYWLVEPVSSVTDPIRRSHSRLIAILLVLLLPPAYLFSGVTNLWLYRGLPGQTWDFLILAGMIPAWIAGYFWSRVGRYELAAVLLTFLGSLDILLSTLTPDGMFSDAIYVLFPVLFSSAVLHWRYTFALVIFDLVGLTIFLYGMSQLTFNDFFSGPLGFFCIGSVLMLIVNWHRDRLEVYRHVRLAASENRLRTVLETMPTMLVAIGEEGTITTWNRECERVTGFSAEEIIGNPAAFDLLQLTRNPQFQKWRAEMHDVRNLEWNIRCKDGSFKTVAWTSSASLFRIKGWKTWGIGMDMTAHYRDEIHRLELALEREQVKMLKQFLDSASHDLRTPITTLKTSLYLLKKLTDTQKREHYVAVAEAQSAHLEKVLADMLNMLHVDQTDEFTPTLCDLNQLAQSVVDSYTLHAVQKRQNLQFEPGLSLPPVKVDPAMFKTALNHLVENAVNYTPEGGTITARVLAYDRQCLVEVSDTGMGIQTSDLPHIFEPFYRADRARNTRTGGAGLGLTIAKRIVEIHLGHIEVESAAGQGSTFRVVLPADIMGLTGGNGSGEHVTEHVYGS